MLYAIGQESFMAEAHTHGANISKGSLFAGDMKCSGPIHWVINTPKGWRISQQPASKSTNDKSTLHQAVSKIRWLAYQPDSADDLRLPNGPVLANEHGQQVTALGFVLFPNGNEISFGSIGATGTAH